jgi:hypothetical protein
MLSRQRRVSTTKKIQAQGIQLFLVAIPAMLSGSSWSNKRKDGRNLIFEVIILQKYRGEEGAKRL